MRGNRVGIQQRSQHHTETKQLPVNVPAMFHSSFDDLETKGTCLECNISNFGKKTELFEKTSNFG